MYALSAENVENVNSVENSEWDEVVGPSHSHVLCSSHSSDKTCEAAEELHDVRWKTGQIGSQIHKAEFMQDTIQKHLIFVSPPLANPPQHT